MDSILSVVPPEEVSAASTSHNRNHMAFTMRFYDLLWQEIVQKNPYLSPAEQRQLQSHYPTIMASKRCHFELLATVYASRRCTSVQHIWSYRSPLVFDAGCGYGSESFLFAAAGASVVAADLSPEQVAIARKRQRYYEDCFGKAFDIEFIASDLNDYLPAVNDLSLTWIASVLAAVRDQEALLARIHAATRPGGEIMITDMNLLNPLFLVREWRRRRQAKRHFPAFARHANFLAMLLRRNRRGARLFKEKQGPPFDDVQFFTPVSLRQLLVTVGFTNVRISYSGFLPPLWVRPLLELETVLAAVPLLRTLGYFYLTRAQKSYRGFTSKD